MERFLARRSGCRSALALAVVLIVLSGAMCAAVADTAPPFYMKWGSCGTAAGQFQGAWGVATDAGGNVYVVDYLLDRIEKFSASGAFLLQWGTSGIGAGQFHGPRGIAVDAMGRVHVVDSGNNRIQVFDATGSYLYGWGTGGSGNGQFQAPYAIAVDGSGNVFVSDMANNRIQKFAAGGGFITAWGSIGSGPGQFNYSAWALCVDAAGNVYVGEGGSNRRVQKFTSTGSFVVMWGTAGSGDGQFSDVYGLACDSSGNVFVSDSGNQRIQKFSSTGSFLVKWGSAGSADGQFNVPLGIAMSGSGLLYVAENANCRVQAFGTPGGGGSATFAFKWGSCGSGSGQFASPWNVAVDPSGMVYVVDQGNSRIQKFTSTGSYLTQWGSSGSGAGQFSIPCAAAIDAAGNVYVADRGNSRIQVFDGGGMFVRQWGSYGSGDGQFMGVEGVCVDNAGVVYTADITLHRVQRFSSSGAFLGKWGTSGSGDGQFQSPRALCADASGYIYVGEAGGSRVQKFTSLGTFITKWGSSGSGDGQFGDIYGIAADGTGVIFVGDRANSRVQAFSNAGAFLYKWGTTGSGDGQFSNPLGVATGSSNLVYVADHSNCRVQAFTTSSTGSAPPFLTKWGSAGNGQGQFNWPTGVALSASGYAYVVETIGARVQRFTRTGLYVGQWGTYGSANGQFRSPQGIAVDAAGSVYVADWGNDRIQKFAADGTFVLAWGSSGSGPGQFQGPTGVAVDGTGNVYVCEKSGNRVQRFSPTGSFLGMWGSGGSGTGQFNAPYGLAVDAAGNVYVADTYNRRIQKFTGAGSFLATWGTNGTGNGQFSDPFAVAVDGTGTVYVADTYNNRMQTFSAGGTFLTAWGVLGSANGEFYKHQGIGLDAGGRLYVADTSNNRVQVFGSWGANTPPTVQPIGAQIVAEGQLLSVVPVGNDVDGDGLAWSGSSLPAGATVTPADGRLTWTPGFTQAGTYAGVTLMASDGRGGSASVSFTITVTNTNRAPVVAPLGPFTYAEGAVIAIVPSGSDPDGDPLTWSGANVPAFASVDPATGRLNGVPTYTQAGVYANVTLTARDPSGATGSASFTITITNVTHTLVASAGPHGSITPSGTLVVDHGGAQSFAIAPDPSYLIADVLVDGLSVGAMPAFTFDPVTADHTIAASFAPVPVSLVRLVSPDTCLTPAVAHVDVPVRFSRTETHDARGASLTVQLSSSLTLEGGGGGIVEGDYFRAVGTTVFLVTDAGGGAYIVDVALLGAPCGARDSAGVVCTLPVARAPGAGSGSGTVSVTEVVLRDCANVPLDAAIGPPVTVTIDTAPITLSIASPTVEELAPLTLAAVFTTSGCVASNLLFAVEPPLPAGATLDANAGVIRWTPPCGASNGAAPRVYGPYALRATDARGDTASAVFTLTVTHHAGGVSVVASSATTTELSSLAMTPWAATLTDCASAPVTWALSGPPLPPGATFDPVGNTVVWTPACGQAGVYGPFTLTATAATGESGSASFSLTVQHRAGTVAVEPIAAQTIAELATLTVTPLATTAPCAGTPLQWSMSGAPPAATLDPGSGVFTWMPDCAAFELTPVVGPVTLTATASTGEAGSAAFTIHVTDTPAAVAPVTALAITPRLTGNDPGDRIALGVSFAAPPATTVEVWRAPFGHYPEYDDAGGATPVAPAAYPPSPPWTLTAITASGAVDSPPARDQWFYVAFARDGCGDVSPPSAMTGGALNYHLGDVSDGATPGAGDNTVTTADISLLGAYYGRHLSADDSLAYLDVGPTTDYSPLSRPLTDNRLQFEDLMIFAVNTGAVSAPHLGANALAGGPARLTMEPPSRLPAVGETFRVPLLWRGDGTVQGVSARIAVDGACVAFAGIEAGPLAAEQDAPVLVLSSEPGAIDIVALGRGAALRGDGTIATLVCRVLARGDAGWGWVSVEGRDGANAPAVLETAVRAVTPIPDATSLAPPTPNPARGAVDLRLGVHDAARLRLALYDAHGRCIRTLLDARCDAGERTERWDGRDARGDAVRSGVYWARLSADGRLVATQPIRLVR